MSFLEGVTESVALAQPRLPLASASFLVEASQRLMRSLDYAATVATVVELAVPDLADWCALDLLDADGSVQRLATVETKAGFKNPSSDGDGDQQWPTVPQLVAQVLRTESPVLLERLTEDHLTGLARNAGEVVALRAFDLQSALLLPIPGDERVLGVLSMGASRSRGGYTQADSASAAALTSVCAQAIVNARHHRQATQAVELRDALLATVSHDLKSPLATISGHAQVLRRVNRDQVGSIAERINLGAARIESAVARMTAMIDELLDVSQLELGQPLQLDAQPTDLVELARRKVADYQETTQLHRFQLAGDVELRGEWDAPRIDRVLDNLLGNAIKYSPDGGVITIILARDDDEAGAWAVLSVRDPGMGVPALDLPHIFERFHRAGNVGRITGTGIGLAVSGHIVAQHGGTISVDSTEGAGSNFTVRLPLARVGPAVATQTIGCR